MNRLCSYAGCKKIVTNGSRCEKHPATFVSKKRDLSNHHKVYWTNTWKRFRSSWLSRNPLCVHCDALGMVKDAKHVDHIVELKDGGDPYDTNNVQSLCHGCHNRKTAMQARLRKKGKTLNDY